MLNFMFFSSSYILITRIRRQITLVQTFKNFTSGFIIIQLQVSEQLTGTASNTMGFKTPPLEVNKYRQIIAIFPTIFSLQEAKLFNMPFYIFF
jgi:hypothetical protein